MERAVGGGEGVGESIRKRKKVHVENRVPRGREFCCSAATTAAFRNVGSKFYGAREFWKKETHVFNDFRFWKVTLPEFSASVFRGDDVETRETFL